MGEQAKEITELKVKEKKMVELQNLVNQYDKNIDETMNKKLATEVEKIQADFDDKLMKVEDEKIELEKKCKEAGNVAQTHQNLLEQAQTELYETSTKLAQKSNAKSDEVEMLLNDLESANQRATLAEKEAENLRDQLRTKSELEQNTDFAHEPADNETIKNLQEQLLTKEKENSALVLEMNKIQSEAKTISAESQNQVGHLQTQKQDLVSKVQGLETKLESMADYDAIKKDLSILKCHEFGQDDTDSSSSQKKPLEVMIFERSKTLQAENTTLRMDKEHLTQELSIAKQSLAEKVNEADHKDQLIQGMENIDFT